MRRRDDTPWKIGTYGSKAHHWHVYRISNGSQEQLCDRRGRVRWFASDANAQRAADEANASVGKSDER